MRPGEEIEVSCHQCGESLDQVDMAACAMCDKWFHIFCLTPPLGQVPKRAWVCPVCAEQGVTAEQLEQPAEKPASGRSASKSPRRNRSRPSGDGSDTELAAEPAGGSALSTGSRARARVFPSAKQRQEEDAAADLHGRRVQLQFKVDDELRWFKGTIKYRGNE